MPNPTMKMKSGVTAVWGTTDAGAPADYGIVRSVSRKRNAEKEMLPDGDGNTAGFCIYDEKDEFTLEVTCKSGMANPTIGGEITVNSLKAYIMDFEVKWDAKGYKGLSISATRFVDSGIPA